MAVTRPVPVKLGVASSSHAALTWKGGSSSSGAALFGVAYGKLYCACIAQVAQDAQHAVIVIAKGHSARKIWSDSRAFYSKCSACTPCSAA